MNPDERKPTIGLVGPCGSGKTTLAQGLRQREFNVRHIAQEHSYVQDMWQRISHPDLLIFLEVSFQVATARRNLNWTENEFQEQLRRLQHAHQNADLVIKTDARTPESILEEVLLFIQERFPS